MFVARYSIYTGWGPTPADAFSDLASRTPAQPLPEEVSFDRIVVRNTEPTPFRITPK